MSKNSIKTQVLNHIREIFKNPFFETFLARYSQNKNPNSFIAKLLPSHYLYSKGSIRSVNRNGINFCLDISDLVDWHVYFGLKETSHQRLYSSCKSSDIVLDVGTNIGAVLMRLAKIANSGFVFGFEPDPINFERCQNNIALNNIQNIQVNNIALGDKKGYVKMKVIDEFNRGMNKVSTEVSIGKEEKVAITTLDEFIYENTIDRIDLIKIDTEGFELKILRGAKTTLEKFKPLLFIEVDDENLRAQGDSAVELVSFLEEINYSLNNAESGQMVNGNFDFSRAHFDIIAVGK